MDAPQLIGRPSKTLNRDADIFQNPVIAKTSKQEGGINPPQIRNEIIKLYREEPSNEWTTQQQRRRQKKYQHKAQVKRGADHNRWARNVPHLEKRRKDGAEKRAEVVVRVVPDRRPKRESKSRTETHA
jgi:hypothetical protein